MKAKQIGSPDAVSVMAGYYARAIKELGFERPYSICFVPRRPAAKRLFGCDHSKLIARETAKLCEADFETRLRVKGKPEPQHTLDRKKRIQNVKDIYEPVGEAGEKEILIDDIITTGATARAAAKALFRGKDKISVIVFAH
ncbi:MAG: hypothetical protein IJT66_07315 [Clostridia bacterium]|nr:hypothetical protein [Clostridia bacterium]